MFVLIGSSQVIAELPFPPDHLSDLWKAYNHGEPFPENYFRLPGGYAACVGFDSEVSIWTPGIVHCDANSSECACHSASSNQSLVFDEFLILMASPDLYLSEPADIDPDRRMRFESGELVYGLCIVEDSETESVMVGFIVGNNKQCMVSGVTYDHYKEFQMARMRIEFKRNLLATVYVSVKLLVIMIVGTIIFYVDVVMNRLELDD